MKNKKIERQPMNNIATMYAMATFMGEGVSRADALFLCKIMETAEELVLKEVDKQEITSMLAYVDILKDNFRSMSVYAPYHPAEMYSVSVSVHKMSKFFYVVSTRYTDGLGEKQEIIETVSRDIDESLWTGVEPEALDDVYMSSQEARAFADEFGYKVTKAKRSDFWLYKGVDFASSSDRVLITREKEKFKVHLDSDFTIGTGPSDIEEWNVSRECKFTEEMLKNFAKEAEYKLIDSHHDIHLKNTNDFLAPVDKIVFQLDGEKRRKKSTFSPCLKNGLTTEIGLAKIKEYLKKGRK